MTFRTIPLSLVQVRPGFNPREEIDRGEEFAGLVASIRAQGIIQPVTVREQGEGVIVVAGHRRVAAAQEAGLDIIPCMVIAEDAPDCDLVLTLTENLQRRDLSPLELARGIQRLRDAGMTTAEISRMLGKNDAYILREGSLLKLPEDVQECIDRRELTKDSGHQLRRAVQAGVPTETVSQIGRDAARQRLPTALVQERVASVLKGKPILQGMRQSNSGDILEHATAVVPRADAHLLEWAIFQYGSLSAALRALKRFTEGAEPVSTPITGECLMGNFRDIAGLVKIASSRKWEEALYGLNTNTGGMVACPHGPIPSGFVLVCHVRAGVPSLPGILSHERARSAGEQIIALLCKKGK